MDRKELAQRLRAVVDKDRDVPVVVSMRWCEGTIVCLERNPNGYCLELENPGGVSKKDMAEWAKLFGVPVSEKWETAGSVRRIKWGG
jgi:hypothetical protein